MSAVDIPKSTQYFRRQGADLSPPGHYQPILDDSVSEQVSLRSTTAGSGSDDPLPIFANCDLRGTEQTAVAFSNVEHEWTEKSARRFHKLAVAYVKKKLSPAESIEYQMLKVRRRAKAGSVAAEELFRQNRDRQMLMKIKQSIEEYVEFHKFKSGKKI